jgi:PAS domain-containing protein
MNDIELSRFVDALPGLIWTVLPDGRSEFVNQRWCEYTGVPDSVGDAWRDVIHPEDRTAVPGPEWVPAAGVQIGEVEVRLRRFDGEYRWFLLRFSRLVDGCIDGIDRA